MVVVVMVIKESIVVEIVVVTIIMTMKVIVRPALPVRSVLVWALKTFQKDSKDNSVVSRMHSKRYTNSVDDVVNKSNTSQHRHPKNNYVLQTLTNE